MTENSTASYDAIVIGAGAGGLFAAARLQHQGYKTLVVESLDKVGGRASTTDVDGFKINDGAIVIECGGITERTFGELDLPWEIREPSPPILYRIKGKDVDVTGGGWGFLLQKLTRQGAKVVGGIGAARKDEGLPEEQITLQDWLSKYTKNEGVHGIFRNMAASVFAVGSEDLPARVFLTYFTRKSAFKRFGFHPEGSIGVFKALAGAIERDGGTVRLSTAVERITLDGDRITGVVLAGGETVTAPIVISNIGPAATVGLLGEANVPADFQETVKRNDRPTAMITVNFASQERLIEAPGMLSFATSRRLAYIANFTDSCPEMAPEGWNLYVGTAVPKPSVGDFDEESEYALLFEDLRETIPGFDERARIISKVTTRDGWPPQRAVAGFDMSHDTPFTGLWNVGDAVKEYANGGTTACAETAEIVVGKVAAQFAPAAD
ncbi:MULTISPECIES: phytoene desaturase family protein [unclassified Nocardioides]|uniref:phytoene desaturase family protein n=1 Tax=unclassified Nocardioides TaxID=2615069 RepID=UPI0006F217B9|nr:MULTISPECIES: FAD-dependent oxidoreductase [unclassified Nocardioides]KRA37778.1 amine oxidase [Nocardioides sp. Root614]KRA91738.1 amine oxidase [Nocardioides sp. Root682]